MHSEGGTILVSLTRRSLVALLVLPMIVLGITFGVSFKAALDASHEAQRQTDRLTALTQRLCERLQIQRDLANNEVRIPMRDALGAISLILRRSEQRATDASDKAALATLAEQFDADAQRVKVLPTIPCEYTAP